MNKPRKLFWIASALKDLKALSKPVQRGFGLSLFAVQTGVTPPDAKALSGFGGAGVLELVEDDRGGTYRAVYTVKFSTGIYVLHVFQKKSKSGISIPPQDMNLIRDRLKVAENMHAQFMKGTAQ
jgi:phage-related protein